MVEDRGKPNEKFLNADLFINAFLKPCEPNRSNLGVLIFEFSRFYSTDYEHGRVSGLIWTRSFQSCRRAGTTGSNSGTRSGFNPIISRFFASIGPSMSSTTGRGCRRWGSRWLWRVVKLRI